MATDLLSQIRDRARVFVDDNYRTPTPHDYVIIETAMLIGAQVASLVFTTAEEPLLGPEEPGMAAHIENLLDKLWKER